MKKDIIKNFFLFCLMSYSGYKMISAINSLNNFMVSKVSINSVIIDPIVNIDYYYIIEYNELLIARFEWTIIFVFCVIMFMMNLKDISLFEDLKRSFKYK